MAEKYYVGKLKERNGEQEYTHVVRFVTDDDPDFYLEQIASSFYDAEGDEDDGAYWHLDGTVLVAVAGYSKVTKPFYLKCQELGLGQQFQF